MHIDAERAENKIVVIIEDNNPRLALLTNVIFSVASLSLLYILATRFSNILLVILTPAFIFSFLILIAPVFAKQSFELDCHSFLVIEQLRFMWKVKERYYQFAKAPKIVISYTPIDTLRASGVPNYELHLVGLSKSEQYTDLLLGACSSETQIKELANTLHEKTGWQPVE